MATDIATDVPTTTLLRNLITALEDKKAEHLVVLHVGAISNITDYLVLATGNSEPHLRALRIEAEKVLDAAKVKIAGMEQGGFGSGWTVVDAYQVMVHLFTSEQRGNYALEKLWKDAAEVDLKTLETKAVALAKPKVAKAAKPATKAAAAKGKSAKPKSAKPASAKPAPAKGEAPAKGKAPAPAKKSPVARKAAAPKKAAAKPAAAKAAPVKAKAKTKKK